jgi:hypothetical protein
MALAGKGASRCGAFSMASRAVRYQSQVARALQSGCKSINSCEEN